jgi:hypothetical protein
LCQFFGTSARQDHSHGFFDGQDAVDGAISRAVAKQCHVELGGFQS